MSAWKTSTVRLPGGVTVNPQERRDHLMRFEFELKPSWTQTHTFDMHPTESFILFSVEGSVPDGTTKATLESCELEVERSARPEIRLPLSLITVHDTVLEARLRRLEGLIDGILRTDMSETSPDSVEARMAQRRMVLHRLGYKAVDPLDHRRLTTPILFGGCERGAVKITCGPNVPSTTATITLRGLHQRPVS